MLPARVPRVLRTAQLTHFGRAAAELGAATDGVRIYFSEARGGHYTLDQVSVNGGEPTPVPLPFANAEVFDISPDHTELLVGSITGRESDEALWVVPVAGGSPRRVGDVAGSSAAWSPNGETIAYSRGSELGLVSVDGTNPRRLASVAAPALVDRVRWSSTGRVLRFTKMTRTERSENSQWEISADGSNLHELPRRPQAVPDESEGFGSWTPDGRYYVYRSYSSRGVASIWTTCEAGGLFGKFKQKPVKLYEGPQLLFMPFVSPDGRRLFFIGDQERRELVRYDSASRQFAPYLGGIFARWLEFSKDGQWVAYNLSPDHTLWWSKPDGSERQQLSFPPMQVFGSYLSPDDRQIATNGIVGDRKGIFLFPTEAGGKPEQLTSEKTPSGILGWSADGASLFVWRESESGTPPELAFYVLDLKTRQASRLPGSEGLHDGLVSPNGKYVAALNEDDTSVVLYDLHAHQQSELARGVALYYVCWAHDGRAVFFQDILEGSDTPIYRVQIDNHRVEHVTNFAQPFAADVVGYRLTGVTPDDAILATIIRSNSDLYALDVDFP
jgi:Tol biopolymer transport system component